MQDICAPSHPFPAGKTSVQDICTPSHPFPAGKLCNLAKYKLIPPTLPCKLSNLRLHSSWLQSAISKRAKIHTSYDGGGGPGANSRNNELLPPSYEWALSHKAWNKLQHSLHGNGIIAKLQTHGMPKLKKDTTTAEAFVDWRIDFSSWCDLRGITSKVIGPDSAADTDEEKREGLLYLAAAIEDADLGAIVAKQGAGSGPTGFAYLQNEFLQGTQMQPVLGQLLDRQVLYNNHSVVSFKQRFCKLAAALDPQPAAAILCQKFIIAVTRQTEGFYSDCISSASANSDMTDFSQFSSLLTKLCTQKVSRETSQVPSEATEQMATLRAQVEALQLALDAQREEHARSTAQEPAPKKGRICYKCGKPEFNGHTAKTCSANPVCTFTLPDGTVCGGNHLESFCFLKDPSKCKDPAMRVKFEQRIKKHTPDTSAANAARLHESSDSDSDE